MSEIITDIQALRQVSKPVEGGYFDKAQLLFDAMPKNALGLSACQIGKFERMFLATIGDRQLVFVNPRIFIDTQKTFVSVEGCLSLPGISRSISRYQEVTISADSIIEMKSGKMEEVWDIEMIVQGLDAAVVQHEYDHLEGTLIIDHPNVKTNVQKMLEKADKRQKRILDKRRQRKTQMVAAPVRINPKRKAKLDKIAEQAEKRYKRSVRRQEELRVLDEGIEDSNQL